VPDPVHENTLERTSTRIEAMRTASCRLHPQLARAVVAACKLPQETIDQQATWLRETLIGFR
jgi:hypothetical protein